MVNFTARQLLVRVATTRVPIWLLVTCLGIFFGFISWGTSSPQPVTKALKQRDVVEQVSTICHLHYRLWKTNPIDQPETLFDVLGLDPAKHPFTDPTWLTEGEMMHDIAVQVILKHWADRRNRLAKSKTRGERQHHLDQAGQVLSKPLMAKVYMASFLPEIQYKRGDRRLQALEDYCGDNWGLPPTFQESDKE